jgi:hypothetical protein
MWLLPFFSCLNAHTLPIVFLELTGLTFNMMIVVVIFAAALAEGIIRRFLNDYNPPNYHYLICEKGQEKQV